MSPLPAGVRARLAAVRDRSRSPRRPGPRASTGQLARLKQLTTERRYADAVALAQRHLGDYPQDEAWLRQAVSTLGKAGAITGQRDAARLLGAFDPAMAAKAEQLDGRLRETSPSWRPEVGGEPEPLAATPGKVLHLLKISLPYRQSGYSVRSKYTVEGQLAAGLEPVVLTALGFPRQLGVPQAPPEEAIGGVRYLRLDPGAEYDFDKPADRYLQDYTEAASKVVRAEAPAVIHVHSGHRGFEAALVGLALGRHFDIPVVYEVRGFFESLWTSDTEWSESSEIYRRRRDTENRCMGEADAVVTLSESMREEIIQRGVHARRVHVVPNGVDVDAFQPRERSAELAARLGVQGAFTFGYVSNLDHYREGQELLVEAAVGLRRRGIRATALIVGDGQRRAELERLADQRQAGDAVIFTGRVPHEEVLDYYALLDVFVIPRVDERAARLVTPLKPFEAMAAGIPLVTSDLPALREITGDGSRGRYFPAGQADGLTDVLAQLHADPSERSAMAHRAREWVVAERQWSANGQRYAELYASLHRD